MGAELLVPIGRIVQQDRGLKIGTGAIGDVTIIGARSSIKHVDRTRDSHIQQTRKR